MSINPVLAQYPAWAEEPKIPPKTELPGQTKLNDPDIFACFYKGIDPSEIANSPVHESINQAVLESLRELKDELDKKKMAASYQFGTPDWYKSLPQWIEEFKLHGLLIIKQIQNIQITVMPKIRLDQISVLDFLRNLVPLEGMPDIEKHTLVELEQQIQNPQTKMRFHYLSKEILKRVPELKNRPALPEIDSISIVCIREDVVVKLSRIE